VESDCGGEVSEQGAFLAVAVVSFNNLARTASGLNYLFLFGRNLKIAHGSLLLKLPFQFRWYNPRKDMPNAPSLSKAYAYYEHVSLPRHFSGEGEAAHVQRRAEPGESTAQTELYSPFLAPSNVFIEWGIGVDLYFSTLRIVALILFIAGLIHLPNLLFYRNDYSDARDDAMADLTWSLMGSAVCTTQEWVACLDCPSDLWNRPAEQKRFGVAQNGTILVKREACNFPELPQGIVSLVGLFFLSIAFFVTSRYLRAREVRFDEDKVTTTDYSIMVKNPPPDAKDPDEWRDFFSQFAEKQ